MLGWFVFLYVVFSLGWSRSVIRLTGDRDG